MICGSGGSKSRLAKAAGAEPCWPDERWKIARRCGAKHISKMYKTHQLRTTFGSWDVEKVHAVVARSTFRSQNVLEVEMSKKCTSTFWSQNTPAPDHFWKLRCRKSARCCGAKHISKSKCTKHSSGPLLEVEMSKKCTPLWREAHFEVKSAKTDGYGAFLDVQMCFRVAGARDCAPCQKWAKREGFVSISKSDGRRGKFEEDLQRCISRGRRSTKDMFIRDVRRSGRWFPERGCILEHQIFRFAEMILRDRCSTSYDLASLFRGRRSTFDRWTGKIAKRIGTKLLALHSTFHFWRKSRRIALFLMLSSWKIEEVSQKCFVCDVVNFEKWGSLAELLRFWCCQLQKMRRSRSLRRKCCVFDVVNLEKWRSLVE